VKLTSTRFGELDVPADAVLEIPGGLIGLGGSRWALLARAEDAAFLWLHAVDDPDLAVPVCDPWTFFDAFEVVLSDDDAARLGVTRPDEASVYVTVRAAEALEDFTANLRAPILVAGRRALQVINQAPDAPVRAPLFAGTPRSVEQAA
jgi:flagellar assembly factor FliW